MAGEDAIRQCYGIDDDHEAMGCIKTKIREVTDSCKPRLVLLVREGCGGCAESKKAYAADIKSGDIKTVSINSEEGRRIAQQNNVETVPSLLVLDCHDDAIV